MLKDFVSKLRKANEEGLCPPQDWTHHAIKIIESLRQQVRDLESTNLRQAEYVKTYKSQVERLTQERETDRENILRTVHDMDRAELRALEAETQVEQLNKEVTKVKQERDDWKKAIEQITGPESYEALLEAQAQKLKDQLTRCSAMFDEVENALAASCRREGKYKKALVGAIEMLESLKHVASISAKMKISIFKEALDEIDDYEADNPPPTAGEKRPATDIQRIIRKAIAQEARQEKVNLPGFQLDDKYPDLAPGPTLKPEEPDLSKCPNCGGPADNGNDRCVPPNAYNCTKCTEAAEDNP